MCGILGGINIPVTSELLYTIKHRGPDYQAIWKEKRGDEEVYMGHTRLAIVDLTEAGRQPMVSECGNYVLIFNGEIYNHLTLRRELRFNRFRGHSDTETLLYLLIEQGEQAIGKLNGIFSFAFYDRKAGKMLLSRDPYGVKPLYYYAKGNCLLFSSELRPILTWLRPNVDAEILALLLSLRYTPAPYTLYKGVLKLRPGHYMEIQMADGSVMQRIWPYLNSMPQERNISWNEAIEEYGRRITEAVDRQLMGDVEMGVLLSGGVDSAVVAALASRNYNGKMKAFTVGYDSKYEVNEIEMAQQTAEYLGMEHWVVKMSEHDFFDTFRECIQIVEEPLATASLIPMYYLSKLASQHVKVVLTGQGADEPLGGYGRYKGEWIASRSPRVLFKIADILVKKAGAKNQTLLRGARALSIADDIERFVQVYSCFTSDEVCRMTGNCSEELGRQLVNYYYNLLGGEGRCSVEKMMSIDMHMNLADDLLLYTDKITMNFSLECRVPMLDHELVRFIQSLPTSYKLRRGKTKIIHKTFARQLLPKAIVNRPKLGFQLPTQVWFRQGANLVKDILTRGKIADVIDTQQLSAIIKQHVDGYNRETQIFLLLSINEWLEKNKC